MLKFLNGADWVQIAQEGPSTECLGLLARQEQIAREIDDNDKVIQRNEQIIDDPNSKDFERIRIFLTNEKAVLLNGQAAKRVDGCLSCVATNLFTALSLAGKAVCASGDTQSRKVVLRSDNLEPFGSTIPMRNAFAEASIVATTDFHSKAILLDLICDNSRSYRPTDMGIG
jgi:hypothetical protein